MNTGMLHKLGIAVMVLGMCGTAKGSLSSSIAAILKEKKQSKAIVGIQILDGTSGRVVYEMNSHRPMIPASNMKLVTTAAAQYYLGGKFACTTKIGLLGDGLVVIGGGDPLLGDAKIDEKNERKPGWIFEDILAVLREKNIVSLSDLYIDTMYFDDQRAHPGWPRDQLNRWYAAEVCGLNYNNNCIDLIVKNNGGKITFVIDPPTQYVTLVNQVKATTSGSSEVGAYRNSEPNRLIVRGKCRKETGFPVAIERPGAFFGFLLYERLKAGGITIRGNLSEKYIRDEKGIRILREYQTPLSDILDRCNKDSLGMAAECLVKILSAEHTRGKINGEWSHGLELMKRYLVKVGAKPEEFHLDDGSGLSRNNRLSANTLTRVLMDRYRSQDWPSFKNSLAVGGVDGTVSKYFGEGAYKGKVYGKTGYIEGVRAFSGFCETTKGTFVFSILTEAGNGYTRDAINSICKAIIDEVE
ncbi:MAG: D-alanyl-D-alanine carboxypeptidase/D-alanyl-D-alanine-endopeptidase [Phycisphaerae bacterium]|nr:D-alanyl-D-alanine carboxypeptidase/D-alanyl-D-alanine-endopeptidase [Phycisphaerae bacterium]